MLQQLWPNDVAHVNIILSIQALVVGEVHDAAVVANASIGDKALAMGECTIANIIHNFEQRLPLRLVGADCKRNTDWELAAFDLDVAIHEIEGYPPDGGQLTGWQHENVQKERVGDPNHYPFAAVHLFLLTAQVTCEHHQRPDLELQLVGWDVFGPEAIQVLLGVQQLLGTHLGVSQGGSAAHHIGGAWQHRQRSMIHLVDNFVESGQYCGFGQPVCNGQPLFSWLANKILLELSTKCKLQAFGDLV